MYVYIIYIYTLIDSLKWEFHQMRPEDTNFGFEIPEDQLTSVGKLPPCYGKKTRGIRLPPEIVQAHITKCIGKQTR